MIPRNRPLTSNTRAVYARGKPIYPGGSPNPTGINSNIAKPFDPASAAKKRLAMRAPRPMVVKKRIQ